VTARILVVEDERDLALGLRANLEIEGYEVVVAHSGEEGIARAAEWNPDLVMLDLMLPGIDGYEVLSRLRDDGMDAPVLILSARAEEVDKVRGFRSGADDYVPKPFGVMELLVRIEALLRRAGHGSVLAWRAGGRSRRARSPALRLGDAEVDLDRRLVRRDGRDVALPPKEFELLRTLVERQGEVVSRHELLRDVWGYCSGVTTRTVDTHVAELRKKIEVEPRTPRHILTVWKVGYRFCE
jgi:two-component system alkaline phosphatase synthesis response regulator PhoP